MRVPVTGLAFFLWSIPSFGYNLETAPMTSAAGVNLLERPDNRDAIGLNLVRGMASIVVVAFHARAICFPAYSALAPSEQTLFTKLLYAVTKFGTEGVLIFFVLSGYLVFGRIIQRLGTFDGRRYATDRAARIMVPLVPACLLTAAVALVVGYPITVPGVAAHMVGLNDVLLRTYQVNAPLWTITYEIWFYAIGGAVGAIAAHRKPIFAVGLLAIAILVFSKLDARYLLYWLLGGLMVLFREERSGRSLALLGLALLMAGVSIYQMNADPAAGRGSELWNDIGESVISIGFSLTLPFLASQRASIALLGIRRFATGLSAVSYSLYLTHMPMLAISRLLAPPMQGTVALAAFDLVLSIAFCVIAASIFWWIFEHRTEAVRRMLRRV